MVIERKNMHLLVSNVYLFGYCLIVAFMAVCNGILHIQYRE